MSAATPTRRRFTRGADDLHAHARAALADLVRQTGAIDGAFAVRDGHDLRVTESLRLRFARRTVCGHNCPAVANAATGSDAVWLEPSAPEGFYLPPHTQVLYVPFSTDGDTTVVALLAYDQRIEFSYADRHFLRRALSTSHTAPAVADLPLAA